MVDYPANFRKPEIDGFQYVAAGNVVAMEMEGGRFRRRRSFKNMVQTYNMTVVLPVSDLGAFQAWWDANAYDWFNMPINSALSPDGCQQVLARCISDLQISSLASFGWLQVAFQMESGPEVWDAS